MPTSDAPVSISAHATATALTAWHFGLSAPRLPPDRVCVALGLMEIRFSRRLRKCNLRPVLSFAAGLARRRRLPLQRTRAKGASRQRRLVILACGVGPGRYQVGDEC
jgi:hypothetical protein